MDPKEAKLEIKSVRGASNLFFQFIYSDEEKKAAGDAYELMRTLMEDYLCKKYAAQGRAKYNNEAFYTVEDTDNGKGFCLSVQWGGGINENEALELFAAMVNRVKAFDPDDCAFEDDELKALVTDNIVQAKSMAEALRKYVLEEHRYLFKSEYWSYFD